MPHFLHYLIYFDKCHIGDKNYIEGREKSQYLIVNQKFLAEWNMIHDKNKLELQWSSDISRNSTLHVYSSSCFMKRRYYNSSKVIQRWKITSFFWDLIPCRLVEEIHWLLVRIYWSHLQGKMNKCLSVRLSFCLSLINLNDPYDRKDYDKITYWMFRLS